MRMAWAYLNHRIHAKRRHGVHSPLVFELGEKVFHIRGAVKSREIEGLRKGLTRNTEKIKLVDYGAGSRLSRGKFRTISQIVTNSATPAKVAQMLQRLIVFFDFKNILEVGTNLALTTAYLGAAPNRPRVISLEGDPGLVKKAVNNLEFLKIHAEVMEGRFEETLALALGKMERIDFAYIDGNHRKTPTLNYFREIVKYSHPDSIIALGDIHWSDEMEETWEMIKQMPGVTLTIDLFDLGLVFFRSGRLAKEHFRIRL